MTSTRNHEMPVRTSQAHRKTYRSRPIDPSVPTIHVSQLLLLPYQRPGRRTRSTPLDPFPDKSFGDRIIQKDKLTTRLFFQNVKGLTYSTSGEDYRYYLSCLQAYAVDIAGLAETNTCWSHPHVCSDFRTSLRRQYRQSKVRFGSPTPEIDPCPPQESFQSGGSLTVVTDGLASCVNGTINLSDTSGLGRWSGISLMGKDQTCLAIITAYRICSGTPRTAPLGSAFLREHEYYRSRYNGQTNPRHEFLTDLSLLIHRLQDSGHMIILMLYANTTIDTDQKFASFIHSCDLHDLHQQDPSPSTYIGASSRRIDFILGCGSVRQYVTRSGTLAYSEGPQSDHRGLYIDLRIEDTFAHNASRILPPTARSLHNGNPEHVLQYHKSMIRYYTQHNMVQRIDQLYRTHTTLSRDEVRILLTKWDNDQGRAMAYSEALLRNQSKVSMVAGASKFCDTSTLLEAAAPRSQAPRLELHRLILAMATTASNLRFRFCIATFGGDFNSAGHTGKLQSGNERV